MKPLSKNLLRALVIVVAALAVAPFFYARLELAPFLHEVVGVDVSNHQGAIDWQALATSGIGFAYVKATEGESFRDLSFARNWSEAARAGIPRGAYHFFTRCRSADAQAQNFIAAVPNDPAALPPVVDAEHMGPCADGAMIEDVATELWRFLYLVEQHYGRRPVVYTTAEFDAAMLEGRLTGERFWVRSLVLPPDFRTDQWVIWQYHNRGRRPGIAGSVDLDVFRGTRADFRRFAAVPRPASNSR
jgi:lysozyme